MDSENQRLDKWLYYCRFVKSRKLAADLITQGKVRVNRLRALKPAKMIRPGDILTFVITDEVQIIRVLSPGERRGPAKEAQNLYERVTMPPETC